MKRTALGLIIMLWIIGGVFVSNQPVPAAAQDSAAAPACGLGQYWLVADNVWSGVWIREGSSAFKARWSLDGEEDVTAALNISLDGSQVVVSRTDDPNSWGTYSCSYTGQIGADGLSISGTSVCQTDKGQIGPLDWSATMVCGPSVIGWGDKATRYRAAKNQVFYFVCPPNGSAALLWGTDRYTFDSSICTAAVHAGVISLGQGGAVAVEMLPGQESYLGSEHNGVTSEGWGAWEGSFQVSAPTEKVYPVIPASFNLTAYRGQQGDFTFDCLPLISPGAVWGTDLYTDDSSVCTAAVHAGIIGRGGGSVTVRLLPGQAEYKGSSRNDIDTGSYGAWVGSFAFVDR